MNEYQERLNIHCGRLAMFFGITINTDEIIDYVVDQITQACDRGMPKWVPDEPADPQVRHYTLLIYFLSASDIKTKVAEIYAARRMKDVLNSQQRLLQKPFPSTWRDMERKDFIKKLDVGDVSDLYRYIDVHKEIKKAFDQLVQAWSSL